MIKVSINSLDKGQMEFSELLSKDMPSKVSYWIAKAYRKADKVIKEFYEMNKEKIKELGNKEILENGDPKYTVLPENKEKYNEWVKEGLEDEVELEGIRQIKLSELGNINIKPSILAKLDWLIIDDVEEDATNTTSTQEDNK